MCIDVWIYILFAPTVSHSSGRRQGSWRWDVQTWVRLRAATRHGCSHPAGRQKRSDTTDKGQWGAISGKTRGWLGFLCRLVKKKKNINQDYTDSVAWPIRLCAENKQPSERHLQARVVAVHLPRAWLTGSWGCSAVRPPSRLDPAKHLRNSPPGLYIHHVPYVRL